MATKRAVRRSRASRKTRSHSQQRSLLGSLATLSVLRKALKLNKYVLGGLGSVGLVLFIARVRPTLITDIKDGIYDLFFPHREVDDLIASLDPREDVKQLDKDVAALKAVF
jgi:hypothetical protein